MQDSSKPSASRFVVSAVVAFVLAVFLTVITYVTGIYFGCVKESAYTDSINNKKYLQAVEKLFYEDADAAIMPVGLPTSVLDGVYNKAEAKSQILSFTKETLKDKKYSFDTTNLENRLKDNIDKYLTDENITLTDEQIKYKDDFIKEVRQIYISNLEVPVLTRLPEYLELYTKAMKYALPFSILLSIICIMILIRMYTWRHRALRFVVYSTTATAIMTISLPLIGLISGFYKRVGLRPEYFYNFFVSIASRTLKVCLFCGILWIIITALLALVIVNFKKHGVHRHHKHHSH